MKSSFNRVQFVFHAAFLVTMLLLLFVVPFSAQAETWVYDFKWGSAGSGNGQFNSPGDIAIDTAGNVYVVEGSNRRVQKFDSSGTYVTQWGSAGTGDGQFSNYLTGVGIDPATNNVFVGDANNVRVQKFNSSGTYLTKWGTSGTSDGQFNSISDVTVDTAGGVYVSDAGSSAAMRRMQKFSTIGVYVTKWGSGGSGNGQFNQAESVSTDSSNNVYVVENVNNRVQKFDSSGTYITQWGSTGSGDGQFSGPTGSAIDSSGNIYVADYGNNRVQKFDSSGTFITKWGSSGSGNGQFNNLIAVAYSTSTGKIYTLELSGNRVQAFTVLVAPTVTTQAASAVTFNSATLNGNITATGGANATARGFLYGLTTSYGATTTASGSFGTGAYTGSVSSLTCNTEYHFKAYATNSDGTSYGADTTFTTSGCPPTVTTQAASSLTQTTATLNGNITSIGDATPTIRGFVYGTTTPYTATTTESGSFSTGAFTGALSSLTCNTVYYFNAYATNSNGTAYGSGTTTTTTACAPTVTTGSASSISNAEATLGGNITNTGGATVTARGFVYGLTTSYGATTTASGSFSAGTYTRDVTGLTLSATYHFKAYATNSVGTSYGSDNTFTTITDFTTIQDGDWTNGATWGNSSPGTAGSDYPATNSDATVAHQITFSADGSVRNLTLNNNSSLTLGSYMFNVTESMVRGGEFGTLDLSSIANSVILSAGEHGGSTTWGASSNVETVRDADTGTYFGIKGTSDAVIDYGWSSAKSVDEVSIYWFPGGQSAPPGDYSFQYYDSGIEDWVTPSEWDISATVGSQDFETTYTFTLGSPVLTTGIRLYRVGPGDQGGIGISEFTVTGEAVNPIISSGSGVLALGGDTISFADITFSADSGTVLLNGTNQNIVGSINFSAFTKSTTNTDTLTFEADQNYYFDGDLNLNGVSGGLLSLRSSYEGNRWSLESNTGLGSRAYVDIMDSNSVNEIDCIQNCIDSGNNPNWIFPGIASLSTLDVSSITTTAATLNGYIDETGGADLTQIGFEYGTTTSYGATTTETGLFIDGAFSDDLTGLTSSTTYHYRAYGINSAGIAYSSDASFTTSAIPPAPTPTPTPTPSSGGGGGASISSRIKNLVSTGNLPLAQQLVNQYPGAMTDCPVGLVCVKNAVAPTNPAASNKPTSVVSFTRSLTTGSSGTDVKNLQIYLNSKGYIIAPTGLGSKGKETTLFGALTRQALIKFQKDHKISPAAGFFGPLTRKFVANNP